MLKRKQVWVSLNKVNMRPKTRRRIPRQITMHGLICLISCISWGSGEKKMRYEPSRSISFLAIESQTFHNLVAFQQDIHDSYFRKIGFSKCPMTITF